MKNDMDVDVTFEGDNTVMMQQVCLAAVARFGPSISYASSLQRPLQACCPPRMLLAAPPGRNVAWQTLVTQLQPSRSAQRS